MITVIDETTTTTTNSETEAAPSSSSPPKQSHCDSSSERNNCDASKPVLLALPAPSITANANQGPPVMDAVTAKSNPINNSDLVSRLQKFLPKLKSANQELLSSFPTPNGAMGSDPLRLDANLELEKDSDSDSDSDSDENEAPPQTKTNPLIREVGATDQDETDEDKIAPGSKHAPSNDTSAAPTIQLQFALQKSSGNPLMKLLADDSDEDDDDSDESGDGNGDTSMVARRNAVANLLQTSADSTRKSDETKNLLPFESITKGIAVGGSKKTAGKKRLITELS